MLFVLFAISHQAMAQNIEPEWQTYDLDKYASTYWIDEQNNELIELVASNSSKYWMNNFEFHYFDLSNHQLLRKTLTNTYYISPYMKLNRLNSLFYFTYLDTAYFFNKDDFKFNSKFKLPFSYKEISNFTFDNVNNNYKLFSLDSSQLVIAKFDANNYELIKYDTLNFEQDTTPKLIVANNAALFALKTASNEFSIYSSENLQLIRTIKTDLDIYKIAISDNGNWISVFTNFIADDNYRFYNLPDSSKDFTLTNNYFGFPLNMKFNEKSDYFLISYYYRCFIYDANTKDIVREIESPNTLGMIDFFPDGNEIVTISYKKIVHSSKILDSTFDVISDFDRFGKVVNLSNLRIDKYKIDFYVSGSEGTLSKRAQSDGHIEDEYQMSGSSSFILNQNIGDTLIAYTYHDNAINYIDVHSKAILESISLSNYTRYAGRISKDNNWFASLITFSKLFLANLNKFKSNAEYHKITSSEMITFFAFSDDARYFALGVYGNKIKVYDLRNLNDEMEPLYELTYPEESPNGSIIYLKFIDNNKKLISSSSAIRDFYVWDLNFEEIEFTPQSDPLDTLKYINYTRFFEYRSKFNDYISIDNRNNLYFWTTDFQLRTVKNLTRSLLYDIANSFEYDQETDALFIACNSSTIARFHLDDATSIIEDFTPLQSQISISPNPTWDFLDINLNDDLNILESKIQIYNVMGRELYNEVIHFDNSKVRINIEGFPIGTYIIRIGNQTAKFVKI